MTEQSFRESPDAVKADIERTRHEMGQKIDAIQERLSPDTLKQQAEEALRDAINSSKEAVSSYFKENSRELVSNLADTVKHHPLPAAMIGIGIGWLLMDSFSSSGSSSYRGGSYPYGRTAQNPYAREPYSGQYRYRDEAAVGTPHGYAGTTGQTSSYGRGYNADFTNHESHDLKGQLREGVEHLRDQVGEIGETVQESVSHISEQVRSQAQHLGEKASDQVAGVGYQAQYRVQRTGAELQRTFEDNPLVVGATALAIGAAVGFLLPSTRYEDRTVGPMRDQVVQSAQEMAQEVGERAKQIVEEVRPELEDTARRALDELKETGQTAFAEVKETSKEAVASAVETAEKAGKKAGEEAERAIDETRTNTETHRSQY